MSQNQKQSMLMHTDTFTSRLSIDRKHWEARDVSMTCM